MARIALADELWTQLQHTMKQHVNTPNLKQHQSRIIKPPF